MEVNKKLSGFDFVGMLTMTGGVVLGCVAGRTAYAAIHDDNKAGTEAEKKNNKMMGYAKRVGLAAVGVTGAAAIKGTDAAAMAVRSMGVGMAAIQAIDGGKSALANNATVAKLKSGNKMQKSFAAGLGLGCPCDAPTYNAVPLNGGKRRKRSLGNPNLVTLGAPRFVSHPYNSGPIVQMPSNTFASAVAKGQSVAVIAA